MSQQPPQASQQQYGGGQQFTQGSGQSPQMGGQQMSGQQASGYQAGGHQMGSHQMGGHMSGQQMGGQQAMGGLTGLELDDALTPEMRVALHDFIRSAEVCEWCADQCIEMGSPEMSECIRLCRDVADLATINHKFISRDSIFGPDVAETFMYAAEECARECQQHPHAHCQECASVLRRAADSTRKLLASVGQMPAGGMGGGQQAGGQMGQQGFTQ